MKTVAIISQKGGSGKTTIIVPVRMHQRVAYAHAINGGNSVQEYEPGSKAAREIQALYKWLIKKV